MNFVTHRTLTLRCPLLAGLEGMVVAWSGPSRHRESDAPQGEGV